MPTEAKPRRWGVERSSRTGWVPELHGQTFDMAAGARRAYMEGVDPALKGKPDYWIRRHWEQLVRNGGGVRLKRLPAI